MGKLGFLLWGSFRGSILEVLERIWNSRGNLVGIWWEFDGTF